MWGNETKVSGSSTSSRVILVYTNSCFEQVIFEQTFKHPFLHEIDDAWGLWFTIPLEVVQQVCTSDSKFGAVLKGLGYLLHAIIPSITMSERKDR